MSQRKIAAFGCDHAAFTHKDVILAALQEAGFEVRDHGTHSAESTDYPDHIHPVAEDVACGRASLGVIMCGSGNGAAMAANKHKGVRAALCWTSELAALARQHNNANILSIPARYVSQELAAEMVRAFLGSEFEGGRHARRVDKIDIADKDQSC